MYPIDDDQQFILELLEAEKVLLVQGTRLQLADIPTISAWCSCPMRTTCTEAIGRIARFLEYYRKRHGT